MLLEPGAPGDGAGLDADGPAGVAVLEDHLQAGARHRQRLVQRVRERLGDARLEQQACRRPQHLAVVADALVRQREQGAAVRRPRPRLGRPHAEEIIVHQCEALGPTERQHAHELGGVLVLEPHRVALRQEHVPDRVANPLGSVPENPHVTVRHVRERPERVAQLLVLVPGPHDVRDVHHGNGTSVGIG